MILKILPTKSDPTLSLIPSSLESSLQQEHTAEQLRASCCYDGFSILASVVPWRCGAHAFFTSRSNYRSIDYTLIWWTTTNDHKKPQKLQPAWITFQIINFPSCIDLWCSSWTARYRARSGLSIVGTNCNPSGS